MTMTEIADQIKNLIGDEALAAVGAANFEVYDDIDTPGVQFVATLNGRQLTVRVTELPQGTYKVYVFDHMTMETLRDEPDVTDEQLATTIAGLEQEL